MKLQLSCFPIMLAAALAALIPLPTQAASVSPAPTDDHALLMQLAGEVTADHAQIASDHALIANLQAKLAAAQAAPAASTSYGPFTVTGKDVYLTGYNLHIQSGSGSTSGAVNGYGNLIIGYNEAGSSPKRTGSHNLILGTQNNYSSYGGIVDGNANTISGIYASIVGGRSGTATGSYSCIAGGYENTAKTIYTVAAGPMSTTVISPTGNDGKTHSGYLVTFTGANVQVVNGLGATDGEPNAPEDVVNYVTNGLGNLIVGYDETQASLGQGATDTRTGSHDLILGDYNEWSNFGGMVGGSFNTNESPYGSVVTGSFNDAAGFDTVIVGGNYNAINSSANYGAILGGYLNTVDGISSAIVAGENNVTDANNAVVVGGNSNYGEGADSSILGGTNNIALSGYSCGTVVGGNTNEARGNYTAVLGGDDNRAIGDYSSIGGGNDCEADGEYSSISGGADVYESNENGWAGGTYESH